MPRTKTGRAQNHATQPFIAELLERRALLSVSVAGRFIFYSDSVFDHGGNRNSAIAPDKQALLPGQTASVANYTSYSKGINGIIIDLAGWDHMSIPLTFRRGASSDTSTWLPAPEPQKWEVYNGQGVGGSDRLVITWGDDWIKNTWLQVTLGGPGTEMPTPDIFYFGNQVGESGNSPTDAAVTPIDELAARSDPHPFSNPAPITNPHDYNRDGRVDATDEIIARNNLTSAANAIQLFGTSTGPDIRWDFDSFLQVVKPLQHSLQGHQPMVYWSLPLPSGDFTQMLQDGSLQTAVNAYLSRGFVPVIYVSDTSWMPGQLALAQAVQRAGLPVTISISKNDLMASTIYQNNTIWVSAPDASLGGANREWPCLPLANGALGAAYVGGLLAPFKAAGITVNRVMFDDESLPAPWNGAWDAQRNSLACQPFYPPGVLANYFSFETYILNLRTQLEQQVMVNPVHALWPSAYVGNFNESDSSTANPYTVGDGTQMPPRTLGSNTLSMPAAYAAPFELSHFTTTYTQANADNYYLPMLLRTISSALANKQPNTLDIPFVSQFDSADTTLPASQQFGLSPARYQELLRHVWLRGADSQMIFTFTQSASQALPQVDAARSVFDELLGYGAFLTNGTPMNLVVPAIGTTGPIWSGLKMGSQCLIRTFTDAPTDGTVTIAAFPGISVTLPAPTTGATFIVNSDGTYQRVDTTAQVAASVQRALSPAVSTTPTSAAHTSTVATPSSSSSQFWQDWERRKQTLVARARHTAPTTFSTTRVTG